MLLTTNDKKFFKSNKAFFNAMGEIQIPNLQKIGGTGPGFQ